MTRRIVLPSIVLLIASHLLCTSAAAALQIDNLAPTGTTRTTTWLRGDLVSTNQITNALTVFYGTSNGATNTASWASSNVYGNVTTTGNVQVQISSLTAGQLYYSRWYAIDISNTVDWANSTTSWWTTAGAPTSSPMAALYSPVMVDTNLLIVAPSNGPAFRLTNDLQSASGATSSNAALQAGIDTNTANLAAHIITWGNTNTALQAAIALRVLTADWNNTNTALQAAIDLRVPFADPVYTAVWTNAVLTLSDTNVIATFGRDLYITIDTNNWNTPDLALQAGITANAAYTNLAATAWRTDGSTGPATADWSMGGNSITDIGTNSMEFSDGLGIGTDGIGSNIVVTTAGGTIKTNAFKSEVTAVQSQVTANDTDIAGNTSAILRNELVDMEQGLRLATLSELYGMLYSYGSWDAYSSTNYVNGTASSNHNYDADGDYYASSYAAINLTNQIAQYTLNDDAANTTVVEDGGTHTGTLVGGDNTADITTSGKISTALLFDGSADYVTIADNNALSFGDGTNDSPFSVSLWCKTTYGTGSSRTMFGKYNSDSVSEWNCGHLGSTAMLRLMDNSTLSIEGIGGTGGGTAIINDNVWHHLVFTYDGRGGGSASAGMAIWVDGGLMTTASSGSTGSYVAMENNASTCKLAMRHVAWPGSLDDVRLFAHVLTANEIATLYNIGSGTETTNGVTGGNMILQSTENDQLTPPTEYRAAVIAKTTDGSLTNLHTYVSNDGGATMDECTLTLQGWWDESAGTYLYTGATNFTSSTATETNILYRHVTTNLANGIQIHGTAILTD